MNEEAKKYLESQTGKLCEELKKAYLAGQNIVYIITKDYGVVKAALDMNPVYYLNSGSASQTMYGETGTSTNGTIVREGKPVMPRNLFFDEEYLNNANPKMPSFYVVTLKSRQENGIMSSNVNDYLKAFVDKLASLTSTSVENLSNIKKSMVLIVTPKMVEVPLEVSLYSRIVRVEDPTNDEINDLIVKEVEEYDGLDVTKEFGFETYVTRLINLMRGLTLHKISQIFSRICSELDHVYFPVYVDNNGGKEELTNGFKELNSIVVEEKAKMLESSGILKLVKTGSSSGEPSGMKKLNVWLKARVRTIIEPEKCRAEAFINPPGGILLTGIPGTGKSLAAKVTAEAFGGIPLLQLDMGNILDKYQGESEHKMEEALKQAEAMSPCVLWIDEIEKGMAGASGDSEGNAPMKRIIGKLLTWMQEKGEKNICCFVLATANSIENIPPELFRSGRFDEKFYTFLPTKAECVEIFKNQIKRENKAYKAKYSRDLFDIEVLSQSFGEILDSANIIDELGTESKEISKRNKFMTGADITAIIQRAKLKMFNEGEIDTKESPVYISENFKKAMVTAIGEQKTYSRTNAKKVFECYAKLAENNFTPVSEQEIAPFQFFDPFAKDDSPFIDLTDQTVIEHYGKLSNEYDRQLFFYVAVGVNQYLKRQDN